MSRDGVINSWHAERYKFGSPHLPGVRLESREVGTELRNTLGGGKTQESGNAEGAGKRKCGRRGKAEMRKERKCGKRNVIG